MLARPERGDGEAVPESKDALAAFGRVPFLIVRGRKGGSSMAVAAVNALGREKE
jgi:precorrin-8X/cobalt-precorrin-8 methylmutase